VRSRTRLHDAPAAVGEQTAARKSQTTQKQAHFINLAPRTCTASEEASGHAGTGGAMTALTVGSRQPPDLLFVWIGGKSQDLRNSVDDNGNQTNADERGPATWDQRTIFLPDPSFLFFSPADPVQCPRRKNVAREPTHRPLHMLWVCWMPLVPNQSPLACETLSDPPVGALGVGRSCVLAVQGRGGFC
jgi:hypothetical protein